MRGYHGNTDSLSVFLHWSRAGQRESSQPKGPTVLRATCAADTGKPSGGRDSVQTHPSLPCWGTRGFAVVAVSVCMCVCARVCAANSMICSCVACPSAASRISTLSMLHVDPPDSPLVRAGIITILYAKRRLRLARGPVASTWASWDLGACLLAPNPVISHHRGLVTRTL